MNYNSQTYIVLVKQFKASLSLIKNLIERDIGTIYIGTEAEVGSLATIWINEPISKGAEYFVQLLKDRNIIDVLTLSEDSIIFCNQLKELIKLPYLPIELAKSFRDKSLMNSKLTLLNLTVANQVRYDTELDLENLSYPLFIKPSTGYASAGAQRVNDINEINKAVRNIRRINEFALKKELPDNIGIIIEEYIDGTEYSIDSLSLNGETKIFCICEREFPCENNYGDYIYKSCSKETEQRLIEALTPELTKLFKSFNYTGASHTEVRYCKTRKKWYFIESALRIGFSGVIADYFKAISGIDYINLYLDVVLGKITFEKLSAIDLSRKLEGVLMILQAGNGGVIDKIVGVNYLERNKYILSFFINVIPGQRILPYPRGIEYMGHIIATSDSFDSREILIKEIENNVTFLYKEEGHA